MKLLLLLLSLLLLSLLLVLLLLRHILRMYQRLRLSLVHVEERGLL